MQDSQILTDQTDKNLKKKEGAEEEIVNYDSNVQLNLSGELSQESSFSKYELEIKRFMEEKNIILNQNLFLEQIFPIFDTINGEDPFSRVHLLHVVEFGKFSKEHPVELRDFVQAYFNVLDSMKANKNQYTNELIELKKQMEKKKKKLGKYKSEQVLDNGLTSNACLKFSIKDMSFLTHSSERDRYKFVLEDLRKSDSVTIDIDTFSLNKRFKLKINNNDFVIGSLTLLLYDQNNKTWNKVSEEYIMANRVYETHYNPKFNLPNFARLEVDMIFINSKLNLYQKEVNELEANVEDVKHNLTLFDSSINILQKPFLKILAKQANPSSSSNLPFNPHEISEKVEKVVSNLLGKKVILWEKILYTVNKCLLATTLFILIMFRADYATLVLCAIILGMELSFLKGINFSLLLKAIVTSIAIDSLWFLYYSLKYRNMSLLEGDYSGTTYRKFSTILTFFVILMKFIFFVAVWRISELQRYNEINPEKQGKKKTKQASFVEDVKKAKTVSKQSKGSGFARPSIRQSKTDSITNVVLRDADLTNQI